MHLEMNVEELEGRLHEASRLDVFEKDGFLHTFIEV